jgi:tRNA(Ile)-lysidine synthase
LEVCVLQKTSFYKLFEQKMLFYAPYFEKHPKKIAVAVSGGADSLALALLLKLWCTAHHFEFHALTVDHRLRKESAEEALKVQNLLKGYSIPHTTLNWEDSKPKTRIQEKARYARYALLEGWCKENKFPFLAFAHHQDDQLETFWMRFQKKSGLYGLACMASLVLKKEVGIIRPLLSFPKKDLENYLQENKVPWIHDPSNDNASFERVRVRHLFQNQLRSLKDSIVKLIQESGHYRQELDQKVDAFMCEHAQFHTLGYITLKNIENQNVKSEVLELALKKIMKKIGGKYYTLSLDSLHNFLCLKVGKATLGGCIFEWCKNDLWVYRELRPHQKPFIENQEGKIFFDHRFECWFENLDLTVFSLKYLEKTGYEILKNENTEKLPRALFYTLPALYDLEGLALAPHLNYKRENFNHFVSVQMLFSTHYDKSLYDC